MRALGLSLAILLGACSGADEFHLEISWSDGPRQRCPLMNDAGTCSLIPLHCDAVARLRILDAVDQQVLYTTCLDIPASATNDLCGLRDLVLPPDIVLPNRMVRLQFLVWSRDQLVGVDLGDAECPQFGHFDVFGFPIVDMNLPPQVPTPALGREIYFPVGDREIAELELGCADIGQLDTDVCRNRTLRVDVGLVVPPSFRGGDSLFDQVSLRFGSPATRQGVTSLPTTATTALTPIEVGGGWRWTATVPGPLPDTLQCTQAQLTGRVTPTASCGYPPTLVSGDVPVTAYVLEDALFDQLEAALGRELPDSGVVVGFAVDRTNQPVTGAIISPTGPGLDPVTVVYPDDTYTGLQSGGTNRDGLFLSLDAPISTVWRAAAPGWRDTPAFGGVIQKHATAVVLMMDPDNP